MKRRNKANRTEFPAPIQGKKYPRRKCHCQENCGGCKQKTIAEKIDWKKENDLT